MESLPTRLLMVLMVTPAEVLCSGVMSPGQARSMNFVVTGFTLLVNMAYSADPNIRAIVSGIAADKDSAQSLVSRLVMQTVFNVLEQQGRSALLPDAIISSILGQLRVQINYKALECKEATVLTNQKESGRHRGRVNSCGVYFTVRLVYLSCDLFLER
ncbi:hypothetical protein KIN20_018699 [Parelaphostrongylus tenuis]|uniref:Uncharacterized protein n=1 Tax=Parelaphostrongylus tenuis TaxID=148309 RepID=A0AAD5QPS9_PARTN|nr:hypothetical protein KIN20_011379 [Parelaphostrongylus tenuis]KAJ1359878.1 hypothetical protein KIN20_018699 [Parelaphostrongylus tenuis]